MKKVVNRIFVACCIVTASMSVNLVSNAALPFFSTDKGEVPSLAPMLDKATPAIVSISVEGTQVSRQRVPEMFKHFFGGTEEQVQERPFKGLGSGVIIDAKKGYVVTNNHVVDNADEIDSPALLVFPERVKANIQTAINMIGDINRLRPHIKTHKCAEVAKLMMDAGIYKFKCATIAEAEMLGMCKAKDVVLAYQPQGPKIKRFIELIKKYPVTKYSCLTDNIQTATDQSKAFTDAGLQVPVYIDLNVGMNRTGIKPDEKALELYAFCASASGMNIKGLHAYDGHIRNVDFEEKKKACDEAFSKAEALKEKIIAKGFPKPIIIMGGSPAFSVHCKRTEMECSPGTFIYWDHGYMSICPEQDFLPAAVLMTRVLSFPDDNKICTDLGHKSVAAENEITKRVFFPEHESLKAVSQSEEHLVLENNADHKLNQGDVLYGIPIHICPTVALYDSVRLVENGICNGEWKTIARDRKITI